VSGEKLWKGSCGTGIKNSNEAEEPGEFMAHELWAINYSVEKGSESEVAELE